MDRYAEAGNVAAPSLNEGDEQLITRVRLGDRSAFEVLYARHYALASKLAAAQVDNPSDVDDVVADAFASVLQQLNSGNGPDAFFRAYLMTVVRRTAHDRNRAATRTRATADDYVLDSLDFEADHVLAEFESTTIASAFKTLPERWQEVLWYVDIEGMKPAVASTYLGISANAVSSLTIRAREGLRQAYLQNHVTVTEGGDCGEYAGQLGSYARNGLKRTSREKVQAHLEECSRCTAALADLNDVQGAMRGVIFPLVAGVSFTAMAPQLLTVSAVGAASKSMVALGKVGAAVVAGVVVVAAATVAAAGVLQSSPTPPAATAAAWAAPVEPPVSAAPAPTQGAADAGLPTRNPSPTAPRPRVTTTQAVLPVAAAPRSLPTPTSVPEPVWAPVPSPPSSLVPPALPVLSPPPSPTTATPTAVPTSPGVSSPVVSATFREDVGTTASEVNLTIGFSLAGETSATSAEAVFRLSEGAALIPGKTIEPEGWKCTTLDWDTRQVTCTTAALDPGALTFSMGISRGAGAATLDYSFSAPGMGLTTFSSSF
ncbi:sigma-70 family RNA polymerase sigma factor [Paenarthrobacter sp. NPDC089322]|uniref:sigma-70 family RNA polymerase sigma factor n=1 Tax=Paenarthrobacter sp. NPDC089322 TaxID=3155065 RepID=UPI0034230A1C